MNSEKVSGTSQESGDHLHDPRNEFSDRNTSEVTYLTVFSTLFTLLFELCYKYRRFVLGAQGED